METAKVLVLIPTYNEVMNVEKIADRVLSVDTTDVNATIDLFFMDSSSPDGTLDLIKKLAKGRHKGRIFYRSDKKNGLGASMFRAFDHFSESFDHDILVTMDADFSHSPEEIPDLIKAITLDKADVAVGSRYIEGGLIPGTWPLSLIIRTRIAAVVARWVGGVDDSLKELTTNFRGFSRKSIEKMPYNTYNAKGYGFQLYIANYLMNSDLDVKEIPISFRSRLEGEPKGRFSDVLEFFRIAHNLNDDSPAKQVTRFMLIGSTGVIINIGSLYLLSHFFSNFRIGSLSVLAIHISILWNFFWHTSYTFKKTKMKSRRFLSFETLTEFVKYELASSFTQLLTVSVFLTLNRAGIYFLLAQLAGIVAAFLANYYVAKRYIWSTSKTARA